MAEDLIGLAEQVLPQYRVKPVKIKVIQGEILKVVWYLETQQGPLCLKRLRHPLEKMRFSIAAQRYMANHGGKVPAVIPTAKGKDFVEFQGQVFVLYEWIAGRRMKMGKLADLQAGIQGIAAFHRASAGFKPPKCKVSSKLGSWPDYYQSIESRLEEWRKRAAQSPKAQSHQIFYRESPMALKLIHESQRLLEQSSYGKWVQDIERLKCLCHQDYGDGNALITSKGVYVLDLDNVTFDLPIRDLRKIIVKRMTEANRWDKELLLQMVQWYHQANPLTQEQKQVLWIDLLFPHEFHSVAKNCYLKGERLEVAKLVEVAELERNKRKILTPLLQLT